MHGQNHFKSGFSVCKRLSAPKFPWSSNVTYSSQWIRHVWME